MISFIEPFDFERIIIDYFLGGYTLFPFVFIIVIASLCAYMRVTSGIFMVLLLFSALIFSFILGNATFVFVILIFGFFAFRILSRMFN